ncbi:preprotein translocase subunit SecA, partial [Flavobacteriaceae bacterium]|nr:preprotein translocase subunit SecA [Flavobacteriaceae bacterium]
MSFINSILNVFVGSKSKKDLKEVEGIVKQILAFEKEFSSLSHDELRLKTAIFKNIIKDSRKPFNDIIEGLNSKIQSSNNIDEKDEYYTEIDTINRDSNKKVEEILNEILPQAFAVVK